jgi:hypothetical protein
MPHRIENPTGPAAGSGNADCFGGDRFPSNSLENEARARRAAAVNLRRYEKNSLRAFFDFEHALAAILAGGKIELKSETWQWEQTGNICIEYLCDGKPSGISVTEADVWVHELLREGEPLVYLMFPIERLKSLSREAIRAGHWRSGAGDGGRFTVALVRLKDILK